MFFTIFLLLNDYNFKHNITILNGVSILIYKSFKNLLLLPPFVSLSNVSLSNVSLSNESINLSYNIIEYYTYDSIYKLLYNRSWFYIFHHIITIILLLIEIHFKTSNNVVLNGIIFVLESSGFALSFYPYASNIIKKSHIKNYYFITRIILYNNLISYYVFIQSKMTLFFYIQISILLTLYLGSIYSFFKLKE